MSQKPEFITLNALFCLFDVDVGINDGSEQDWSAAQQRSLYNSYSGVVLQKNF